MGIGEREREREREEEYKTVSEYLILPIIIVNSNLQCTINNNYTARYNYKKYMLAHAYAHRIVATRDT